MPMSKRLAAEFIGTFWLVLGGAAARCWPRHFRAWASASPEWFWVAPICDAALAGFAYRWLGRKE